MLKKYIITATMILAIALTPVSYLKADEEVKTPVLNYSAWVQGRGQTGEVTDGSAAGTTGQSLRLEGIEAHITGDPNLQISYKAHVQNKGWTNTVSDGARAGADGLRTEAVQISLSGNDAPNFDIYYRVHVENIGWMGWAKNNAIAGTTGQSLRIEAVQMELLPAGSTAPSDDGAVNTPSLAAGINCQAHIQNIGWQEGSGDKAGTEGQSLRLEAFKMNVDGNGVTGGISYRAYVENIGWMPYVADGGVAGTTGRGLRVEAVQAKLYGDISNYYHLYYRLHVQNYGWLGWACDDGVAGTEGNGLRVESVEYKLVPKIIGQSFNTHASVLAATVSESAHVQNIGWMGWATSGNVSGTTGQGLRMEAIRIQTDNSGLSGGIEYQSHIQNVGWQGWVSSGNVSGTTGQGLRMEAVRIKLTGEIAAYYDVFYRAHIENYGWLGWTANGGTAGSTGCGLRVEAVQVELRLKGTALPISTGESYIQDRICLNVPCIMQNPELPTGCESVALTDVLNYYGFNLGKCTIADNYMPRGNNMITSFTGNPHGRGGGIYPPGILTTANNFLISHGSSLRAYDTTGQSMDQLLTYIRAGHPVLIWSTEDLRNPRISSYKNYNGITYPYYKPEHCVVLKGFNKTQGIFYISDSLAGDVTRSEARFTELYNQLGKLSVVIQ